MDEVLSNESDSSIQSDDEIVNFCLMTIEDDQDSYDAFYDELLDTFFDFYDEFKSLIGKYTLVKKKNIELSN